MEPWSRTLEGRLEQLEIESDALRGNALGDPHVRPLWVSLPSGYDDDAERRYPSLYVIQGLTGQLEVGIVVAGRFAQGATVIITFAVLTLLLVRNVSLAAISWKEAYLNTPILAYPLQPVFINAPNRTIVE